MSWSVSTKPLPMSEIAAAIDALHIPMSQTTLLESLQQLSAAKTAAKVLSASGALGESGFYLVRLSGHAKPEHTAPSGPYSSIESISVYVQQYYLEPNHE